LRIPWDSPFVGDEEIQSVTSLLKREAMPSHYIGDFERKLGRYVSNGRILSVNNGTTAILCALLTAGVKPGDKIIIPTYTFASVATVVMSLHAKPLLTDVDPLTFNMNLEDLREQAKRGAKGVIHVDVSGIPPDIDTIDSICDEYGLFLIEDAAEALGSEYKEKKIGSFQHLTCFSFQSAKQLCTYEGGAVSFGTEEQFEKCKSIINHGMGATYEHQEFGLNFRINPLAAAMGTVQMNMIEEFVRRRGQIVRNYEKGFGQELSIQSIPDYATKVSWGMVLALAKDKRVRDGLVSYLREKEIEIRIPWKPIHLQPYHRNLVDLGSMEYPVAEDIFDRVFGLPLSNSISDAEVGYVLDSISQFLGS